ncbi:CLUMA_CG014624, isoform A [Clunio marinus]|uniref:CLUMA_CG014624, isoform A n=1 Tax=Clunio marinus TaxID=568069 RepID=A0A1J1IN95_9DIPT|nr:CLUMA_CG014624, isoform A [Clunio marinus]
MNSFVIDEQILINLNQTFSGRSTIFFILYKETSHVSLFKIIGENLCCRELYKTVSCRCADTIISGWVTTAH